MKKIVYFSNEELRCMLNGGIVKSVVNHTEYMSADRYRQLRDDKEEKEDSACSH